MSTNFDRGGRSDGSPSTGHLTPVPADLRPTGLTYEPFYGLKEKPFSLTSDSRFFYQSRSHAPAFDDLLNAIRRRESLNVLTGDIGTGKTTLCRAVLQSLDRKTFSAFVPDPFASREELLKVLLTDFGVVSIDDVTSGRLRDATRTELSYLLYDFLATLVPLQAFAVAIIDEAQNLSQQLLEEMRILSDADGQLQVVLVGQLELRDKLRLPEMRQLDQRVSVHCQLQPLDCAGVAGYISHRLRVAGGSSDRVRFTGDAVEAIYELSDGVPRIINRACDRSLRYAYSKREASIDAVHVVEANMDSRVVEAFHPPTSAAQVPVVAAPAVIVAAPPPAFTVVPTVPEPPEPPSQPTAPQVVPPAVVAVTRPEPFTDVPATAHSEALSESFLSELDVLPPIVELDAPPAAVAPILPAAMASVVPQELVPSPSPSGVTAEVREPAPAAGALPAKLELWLSKIEAESEPIEDDWRQRWMPTNAVAEPSPQPERGSGVRLKIPMTSSPRPVTKMARVQQLWTRRLIALVVTLIITLGAAITAPATVAASIQIWSEIDNQLTPPRMPDLPLRPAPPLAAPAHVTPPADPLGTVDAPADPSR